jgi:glucose-6-phosphate dehydrogenase assembly protein OpcA
VSLDLHPVVEALAKARQSPGSMKAATMTFAVYFGDAGVADWVHDRTRALAEKHPSRVVIFDGTKGTDERRVEPSIARGEWIEIGVQDANAHELAAALTMLELPEAPVVLLWIADAVADDDRFITLARRAIATICSTSVTRTDERSLHDLTTLVERHPEIAIHDIAYLRLTAWQELIAEFFDTPGCQRELRALRNVEVTSGSDAEMYYLLGWLASRLAWTPTTSGTFTTSGGGSVHFTMIRSGPPRRLSKVVLASDQATFTASVHTDDVNAISLESGGSAQCAPRCAPFHTVDLASLVERAILSRSRDEAFVESLTMARHIIERQLS